MRHQIKQLTRSAFKVFGLKISRLPKPAFELKSFTHHFASVNPPVRAARLDDKKYSQCSLKFNGLSSQFYYRKGSKGDQGVITQIFENADYDVSCWIQGKKLIEYYNKIIKSGPMLIVDAGANIGASSVYFLKTFDNSFIYSIEPNIDNWKLLELNTRNYGKKKNFFGAIAENDGELILEDPGLSDWGFRTTPVRNNDDGAVVVKSVSPQTILNDPVIASFAPLIFKVDIEGGEEGLFKGDTSWLRKFPLLIIELHDWMLPFSGSSKNFLRAISNYEFDLLHRGENLFFFNREILDF